MNSEGYYYLNIGEHTSTTEGDAFIQGILEYKGTGLGKIQYNSSGTNNTAWKADGSLIADTGDGGWSTTSASSDYTARPNDTDLKRTLSFIFNRQKLDYNSSTAGNHFKHYLCIGLKNNIIKKIKKPDLYIYHSDLKVKKLD